MPIDLDFPALLSLLDDRSAAFRAALAAAPALDAEVPTCPGWTLHELAQHLGRGQRFWAEIVAAGPAETPPPRPDETAPADREALIAWHAASTDLLLEALRAAGPGAPCWTWWGPAQSPQDSTAAARRRLHETAVHTYDAQLAAGVPAAVPAEVALDGVEEFLLICCSTTVPWPHAPAVLAFRATDGPAWYLDLSPAGVRATRATAAAPDGTLRGTAAELLAVLYGRTPIDALPVEGAAEPFHQLYAWDPEA
ncbi:maleylpyruvate isomerase family mycothiol-dependent enzyme [Kitasatospora phosalacinea]|uniref:maleylpyruvate isomerase family mycothiol-dependent enzyme n=1 Tax=Kitasatospora phosalacinea TaxID=2065 RepID=UPI000525E641|nr:maleylpyruvate isomerase family mycothiol-dependent enzyme [Kitasatospora phosalacinea]